jgi:hypothetical protein
MYLIYIKTIIKLLTKTVGGRNFLNYRLYKKYGDQKHQPGAFKLASTYQFAILIQGQFIFDDNFTIETIKLYRYNFPDAILILSTWTISDDIITEIKRYGVHIIQNKMPENPGIANINLQITTSGAGVLLAKELGAKFVLKTRTDQRIYHPSLDAYLFNLTEAYPLSPDLARQTKRFVGVSLNTLKYRLYGVSDMCLYGHIDDMVRYWNIPLDERRDTPEERTNGGDTWRTFSTWRACEVYLCTEFLHSIGRELTYTLRDSFQVFKDHFVIIDQAAIKLYWHKYTLNYDRYSHLDFFDPELSFNDWLVLYKSMKDMVIEESIIDQSISRIQQ